MRIEELDYDLPAEAIAQSPLADRDQARLLVDLGDGVAHRRVCDLTGFVEAGDVVVVNNTRVMPARLRLQRSTGGKVEVLLLEHRDNATWEALVKPSRRLKRGEVLGLAAEADVRRTAVSMTDGAEFAVEVGDDLGQGRRIIEFLSQPARQDAVFELLDVVGEVPLPPYITEPLEDSKRYQTVFSRRPVSAAAPTAGLHLTEELLSRIRAKGAEVATVELAIGLDTFRPITTERIEDHVMHTEYYRIPDSTAELLPSALRVIAIGTTVVRTLETFALTGIPEGRSKLFIRRPFEWRIVDLLMTNFHMPRSSLLCLIDAFVGLRWRDLYSEALSAGYRFLSFGDAMLLTRRISDSMPRR